MEIEEIKNKIEENNIKHILFSFINSDGMILTKSVFTKEILRNNFLSCFDGLSINGRSVFNDLRMKDSSLDWLLILPDMSTFRIFTINNCVHGWFFCEIKDFEEDSRFIIKKVSKFCIESTGFKPMIGMKLAYTIERDEPIQEYLNFSLDEFQELRKQIIETLDEVGIEIEYDYALSRTKSNIDFVPVPLTISADSLSLAKAIILSKTKDTKLIFNEYPTHFSLWKEEKNMFFEPNNTFELSKTGMMFINGILKNCLSILFFSVEPCFYSKIINYKISASINKDGSIINIPCYYIEKKKKDRIGWSKRGVFYGMIGNSNPYLAYSILIAAGVEGIENQLIEFPVTEMIPKSINNFLKEVEKQKEFIVRHCGKSTYKYFFQKWQDYTLKEA